MLAKRIIPCLDVDKGRVVKGVKFFDHRDAGDVGECAVRYDAQGADELVFYDITASHEGRDSSVGDRALAASPHPSGAGSWGIFLFQRINK